MVKLIIGAGETNYEGFISTQEATFDLLNESDWKKYAEQGIDVILMEHVLEHLTLEEGKRAMKFAYQYLNAGGYIRAAVPDAFFQNEVYQNLVQIGGPGPKNHSAASHKIVYDYVTFASIFEENGFFVTLYEYCDEKGDFHYRYWNPDDGKIGRSFRYDTRNSVEGLGMVSIILDAHKEYKFLNSMHKK